MRPCKSCPFRVDVQPGLWHPVEYLRIAYLGSADFPTPNRMSCHQGRWVPAMRDQVCGGWVRAARDLACIRIGLMTGSIDLDDLDDYPVLAVEEMARRNGLDLDKLPPLVFPFRDPRYETMDDWIQEIKELQQELLEDPERAYDFVLEGSPLAKSDEELRRQLGPRAVIR